MAITKLTTDLDIIQALSDKPNEIEGLTADQLKEKFDTAGNEIKNYINDTLTEEVSDINTRVTTAENEIDVIQTQIAGWKPLTATFTYDSADAPTFVMATSNDLTGVLSVGMKLRLTQTTDKYFFITAITASTITMYGGTDYTLANETISNVGYSTEKAPYGFPLSPDKWSVVWTQTTNYSQASPTQNTIYAVPGVSIDVPIGDWNIGWQATLFVTRSATGQVDMKGALSTSTSANTHPELIGSLTGTSLTNLLMTVSRDLTVSTVAKTPYYFTISTSIAGITTIQVYATGALTYGAARITATISYL